MEGNKLEISLTVDLYEEDNLK